jgi:ATP-binding cassette subfamily C protein
VTQDIRTRLAAVRDLITEVIATSPRDTAAAVVILLLLAVVESVGLLMLAPLLEYVGVVEENPLPRAESWVEGAMVALRIEPSLGSLLLLYVAVAGIRAGLQRSYSRCSQRARENLVAAMRTRLYRAIAAAEWKFLVTRPPSAFMHALVSEIARIGGAVTYLVDFAVAVALTTVYLGLAIRLSPAMAALVVGCALVLAWFVRRSLERVRAISTEAAQQRTQLHRAITEHVSGLKLAKSYGVTGRHEAMLVQLSEEARRISLEFTAGDADLQRSLEFGSTVLLAVIVYASTVFLNEPAHLMLVMIFVFARLMPRLIAIYRHVRAITATLPIYESVRVLERECLDAAENRHAAAASLDLIRGVQFDGVTFSYLRRERPAVDRLDLEIRCGETTAIVGASGAGKSTVADLLIGLLTPDAGRLLVDGHPLTEDQLAAWRRMIGYVPQETFLVDDTVRNNLLWAQPGATDAEVWEALTKAAADGFVRDLPQQLDTLIGERGVLVSGGERQRLSVARALLRQPRLLVLDEATSSLDTVNEHRIREALEALHHQLTIVIITHRLSTIRHADVIHVMHDGRIVESGRWDDLGSTHTSRFQALARI